MREDFFKCDFFCVLFRWFRALSIHPQLDLELNQMRRRISDVLLRDGLHEDLSLLRRLVVLFSASFQISRTVFPGVCANSMFGAVFVPMIPPTDSATFCSLSGINRRTSQRRFN
jgi:hypothetical protein